MPTRRSASPPRRAVGSAGRLLIAWILGLALSTSAALVAQTSDGYTIRAVSAPEQTVRPGPIDLTAQVLDPNGGGVGDFEVRWRVAETTAGAYGGGQDISGQGGFTRASFRIPRSGQTRIEARLFDQVATFVIVSRVGGDNPSPPTDPRAQRLNLAPAGPTQLALTVGDRGTTAVRVTFDDGRPAAGVEVRFAVESSPGSPGVGRSDQTVRSGPDGLAAASFGFSTAGRTTIRATLPGGQHAPEPPSILFTVDAASLGTLDPSRQSYRSVGEALDAICLDVFVANGQQRPQPDPTPLCVYMTGTLDEGSERADAMRAFSPTGIGSMATTSLAGLEQQRGSIQSRLAALRGGALRSAVDQIALEIDGTRLSGDLLAAAGEDARARQRFTTQLEEAFLRLYAGLDAQEAPATAPAVAPLRERPWGFFVTGRLSRGEHDSTGEETGFDFDTSGLTIGIDRAVGSNGFVGLALSSIGSQTDLADNGGELEADALAATLYLIREGTKGYVQATLSAGRDEFSQRRTLDLPELGRLEAHADFDGDQLGGTLEFGRSIDGRAGSLTFFARGNWARAEIDGFREEGAVATIPGTDFGPVDFGLEVDAQEVESLLGEAGLDWGRAISTGAGLVIPQLTATWVHEFEDDPQAVTARFLADRTGSSFEIFTDEPDRDWLTASAALRFQFLWGSLFVAYDHDFLRDDFEMRTVNAGLRFEF